MKDRLIRPAVFCALAMTMMYGTAQAQYPKISPEVAAAAEAKSQSEQENSDKAWAEALPIIKEWEAKGKPYIDHARHPDDLPQADIPSFPGAQGGGMYSHGGRGGQVIVVTSLADRGPGTFREAVETGGPRIVVFNVAGIIELKEKIRIRAPYITIAGNTAPGDGVCIAGDTVELETHDVVIRHMRFRRGSTWEGDRNDSIGGNPIGNIMIDHVSASWGSDENMSMYRHNYQPPNSDRRLKLPTVNITIQNSIFSEALNMFNHSFGSTIGGYNSTFHHNLWANNAGRNPSVGMSYDFTFVNNVIFNWRHRTTDGGGSRSYFNMINNYYKPGPVTPEGEPIAHRILRLEGNSPQRMGRAYVAGNIVEGHEQVTADNWAGGVQVDAEGDVAAMLAAKRQEEPYPHAYLEIEDAASAYATVLASAGATLPRRDAVDKRIIETVRTGKTTAKAGPEDRAKLDNPAYSDEHKDLLIHQVSLGILTDISQVGGYPEYKGEPYKDTDGDGMPDAWETKHGLNPNDASDAGADLNGDGYTNIEDFINGLDPTAPAKDWATPRTYQDLW